VSRYGGRLTPGFARWVFDLVVAYVSDVAHQTTEPVARALAEPVLVAVAALVVVGVWSVWRRRRDRADRGRFSAPAWAYFVVAGLTGLKLLVDVIAAPLWALSWYSASQRLILPLGAVLLALFGVDAVARGRILVRLIAVSPLLLLLVPVRLDVLFASDQDQRGNSWQDTIDEAADWVRVNGPPGRYGAWDTGVLGFRLNGLHPVVNLDGLVNDYEYGELVTSGAPAIEELSREGIEFLVQRLPDSQRNGELACARELWRSPEPVEYADDIKPQTSFPVYVLDVRPCTSPG
jgi:hypothetical protein